LAGNLGVNEADLKVFMSGVDVTSSVDTANHIIYAAGLSASEVNNSTFAVAQALGVPEPSTFVLLVLTAIGLPMLRRRR